MAMLYWKTVNVGREAACLFKTIGVLAHVDAGKTTLSEQLLYHGGALRTRGRVDQGDAFLDADPQERARGITIFSGQAVFSHRNSVYQLMDTPGHVDFAAEMERSLAILDAAVLVISAPDGVQGHTETIWRRLKALGVPTFLFLNKCDRCDPAPALCELRARLSDDCIDLTDGLESAAEALAERDEALLETYLADGFDETAFRTAARRMVARRRLFPVFRGSALQDEGVEALLNGLDALLETRYDPAAPFSAQVYGVRRDTRGARLALLKITGGTLSPRGRIGEMTVGELRALRGAKSDSLPHAAAGQLCAAAGLPDVKIGDGLGAAAPLPGCALQPLLAAKASWDDGIPPQTVLSAFRTLEDEDPALAVQWEETLRQLTVRIMGKVQLEVLAETLRARFELDISFGVPEVTYRETIAAPAIGCGHFEPLRHYAEVWVRLEPLPRGSGIAFASECPTDDLPANWQRLIETHVFERQHRGVLTGAPLTDVRIVLLAGRGHEKHTEGGDFRDATYRAIRQGLMRAENLLLEPRVRLTAALEPALLGRLLTDLQRMSAETAPPEAAGGRSIVRALVPMSELLDYPAAFAAFTHGRGSLSLAPGDWTPCHNAQAVIGRAGYEPTRDLAHTPDSVFCSHGAGYPVRWDEAPARMHCRP